jgi:hypothetical protein
MYSRSSSDVQQLPILIPDALICGHPSDQDRPDEDSEAAGH